MDAVRDRALLESVRQRLMEDTRLAGQSIEVIASGGYIEVVGTVDSEEDRKLALHLAEGVAGVRRVANKLQVREKPPKGHL